MKNNRPSSPREVLDKKAHVLADKHQQRLDEMLSLAINQPLDTEESTNPNNVLDQQTKGLEKKHHQRLEAMTEQAIKHQIAAHYLDGRTQSLKQKYQQRLHRITQLALSSQSSKAVLSRAKRFFDSILQPVPMMALASIFAISVTLTLYLENQDKQLTPSTFQANAKLPAWVKDTDVPLELLENMDFYVWLSQQEQYAKSTDKRLLVAAWYNQLGAGKRRTTGNLTQGISGTAPHTGAL